MDNDILSPVALTFSTWLLLQLLSCPQVFALPAFCDEEENAFDPLQDVLEELGQPVDDPHASIGSAFSQFRLLTSFPFLEDDLGYWVKPRSTTWFSRFLLAEYDDTRWIQMFRMTKPAVFSLADLLRPHVKKKDTKYRLAIPVVIRVACCLFKLTHGASLFICSEMFAIGKSTVSTVLRQVVHAINDSLKHELRWPTGELLQETQQKFQDLCGLPGVVGAIDGTHVAISKPKHVPADYFYFKSGGYTLNCQAVVDSEKRFIDLYVGMPGSTNDSRMLRRSSLYDLATHSRLFDDEFSVDGFSPYLIGDLGYPLLPWLLVPHRSGVRLSVAESLFNRKLRRGRSVVENAFGMLKQSFRELSCKSDLEVAFLPDVILCCATLHNMLLNQSHEEVESLLQVLQTEGLRGDSSENPECAVDVSDAVQENSPAVAAVEKRSQIGLYLSMQRQPQN